MLELILYSIISVIILTPCGYIFSRKKTLTITNLSSDLIYGIILISFISLLLNFFTPLNHLVNTILWILPLIILFKKKTYFFSKKFSYFIIFNFIIIFLLLAKSNVYRPDAMLYHLPYTDILNNEKIIFGLTNLHFRFGHISIIQYFSAFFNNYLFESKAIVFASAIIASTVIINFSSQTLFYIKKKIFNFHFFYLFSIIIFIAYKMNRYGEYGNDAPTHFLFFFLISEIIKSIYDSKNYDISNNFILSIFILLNKVTMAFAILLPFMFIKKNNIISVLKLKKFYFGISFLILWIIKNFAVSGCLVYPVSKLCFEEISWTNIKQVEYVSSENEAWTKGWSDHINKNNISQSEYSKNFIWLKTWIQNHFKKIIKILLPYLVLLIAIYSFLFFKYNIKKYQPPKKEKKKYFILILLMSLFSIIWFLKVPVFRYGYSYFISLFALIFSYLCIFLNLNSKNIIRFFSFFLVLSLTVFVSKNSLRIIKKDEKNYNNYWPKIVFLKKNDVKKIKLKNMTYFESNKECGYNFSPCTHYKSQKINSKKILNYKIIYKN